MTDTMLPAPLVPSEVDLRDFAFMPLDVVRLRDSDLAAMEPPEACWAAVLLWCASWHQVPAASVPDDDRVLANLAGFGRVVREWQKLRASALRGWVRCSDGRLYHPVVAEKARDAWRSKLEQRWKTECARIKKHNQRHELAGERAVSLPDFEEWIAAGCPQGQPLHVPRDKGDMSPGTPPQRPPNVPRETPSKGQGEGQGQGQGQGYEEKKSPPAARVPPDPRPKSLPCPEGVDAQVWADWLALRKAKKAPVTDTVLRSAATEAGKAGMSLEAFLRVWCARGSQGLQADWLKPDERRGAVSPIRPTATDRRVATIDALTGKDRHHGTAAEHDRDGDRTIDVVARLVP